VFLPTLFSGTSRSQLLKTLWQKCILYLTKGFWYSLIVLVYLYYFEYRGNVVRVLKDHHKFLMSRPPRLPFKNIVSLGQGYMTPISCICNMLLC